MTFPSGPSGSSSNNRGNTSGFGSPSSGFGSPGPSSGVGGGAQFGGAGNQPPFGARPGGANSRPAFGGAPAQPGGQPTPPPPNQAASRPQQGPTATPAKGKGRFSAAIGILLAILVVLAIVLGVGAWFIWGRDSSGSGSAADSSASSAQQSTTTVEGSPLTMHGSIDTDMAPDTVTISGIEFPDSYVSQGGSTDVADVKLTEDASQLIAVYGFVDDRVNQNAQTAAVNINTPDGEELSTFAVSADEALKMPIDVNGHTDLSFTFTYKDSDGNPVEDSGFAVASLHVL